MERALAHIETVANIVPLSGYDKVEYANILGWWVIISKADMIKVGDKVVYVEIDSRVPVEEDRWSFMRKREGKVKSIKGKMGIEYRKIPIFSYSYLNMMNLNKKKTTYEFSS